MLFKQLQEQLDKRTRRMFEAARVAALSSPGIGRGSYRIGAVIADGRHIIGAGFNSYKSHPKLYKQQYPYLHGEQAVLFKCGTNNVAGMDMYVVRIWKDGNTVAMAKPCLICEQFIKLAEINRVFYTTYGGYSCEYV